ncbi:MAG: hypothetical protein AABX23_03050 [Nanoarchaeota archaeon]
MLERFLKEYVSIVAGSGTDKIVDVLFNKKNVNEFLIAKKLNLTINQTRNILYKLADSGLVRFMRKKDLKSGGWYTYFWTLDEHKCLVNYKESISKEIKHQEEILVARKTKQFYICKNCDIEVSDEQALLNEFTCTECGEVYSLKDSVEGIKEIEKVIQKMTDKASQIQLEIDKIVSSRLVKKEKVEKKKPKKSDKSKPIKKKKKTVKKNVSKKRKKK